MAIALFHGDLRPFDFHELSEAASANYGFASARFGRIMGDMIFYSTLLSSRICGSKAGRPVRPRLGDCSHHGFIRRWSSWRNTWPSSTAGTDAPELAPRRPCYHRGDLYRRLLPCKSVLVRG